MTKTKSMIYCGLFTALIAAGAFIKIPVPVVPFTLQYLFTMEMKNGRTRILENQGFRTCRFYFIKIYMEFDYYLSINVVF